MIDGIRCKVCGLQSIVDAEFADRGGADCLGFILYPQSPRAIPLPQYAAMAPKLPARKRVAVLVEPADDDLAAAAAAGFDFFQIHFRTKIDLAVLQSWSQQIGPERLWLAPRLKAAAEVRPEWLPLAQTFLLDSAATGVFGGSGRTGDWEKFARHRATFPDRTWILAGGLNPENIGAALQASGADFVDVNSGVEAAPGVKDHAKLKRFLVRLHEARTSDATGR